MQVQKLSLELHCHFKKLPMESGIDHFVDELDTIQLAFKSLNRVRAVPAELVVLKFRMMHWRKRTALVLFDYIKADHSDEGVIRALKGLRGLGFFPGEKVLHECAISLLNRKNTSTYLEAAEYFTQCNAKVAVLLMSKNFSEDKKQDLLNICGPQKKLPIHANHPSRCTMKQWSKNKVFSEYHLVESEHYTEVQYRGLLFRPGDVLVCNVNLDGNGVYSLMNDPRSYAYHIGVFAWIQKNGFKIPAVIETFAHGVRAVPLSVFTAPDFNSYFEVYRPLSVKNDFYSRIDESAEILINSTLGYNFDTEDTDYRYLACSSVATRLHQMAGYSPVLARSVYSRHPVVKKNLLEIDLTVERILAPTDFVSDEKMQFMGTIDNDRMFLSLTRECCERWFRHELELKRIQYDRISMLVAVNRFALRQVRSRSKLGRVIGLLAGFNHVNLPKGNEKLLAVIEIYEKWLASFVRKSLPVVQKQLNEDELVDVDLLMQRLRLPRVTIPGTQ